MDKIFWVAIITLTHKTYRYEDAQYVQTFEEYVQASSASEAEILTLESLKARGFGCKSIRVRRHYPGIDAENPKTYIRPTPEREQAIKAMWRAINDNPYGGGYIACVGVMAKHIGSLPEGDEILSRIVEELTLNIKTEKIEAITEAITR